MRWDVEQQRQSGKETLVQSHYLGGGETTQHCVRPSSCTERPCHTQQTSRRPYIIIPAPFSGSCPLDLPAFHHAKEHSQICHTAASHDTAALLSLLLHLLALGPPAGTAVQLEAGQTKRHHHLRAVPLAGGSVWRILRDTIQPLAVPTRGCPQGGALTAEGRRRWTAHSVSRQPAHLTAGYPPVATRLLPSPPTSPSPSDSLLGLAAVLLQLLASVLEGAPRLLLCRPTLLNHLHGSRDRQQERVGAGWEAGGSCSSRAQKHAWVADWNGRRESCTLGLATALRLPH